MITRRLTTAITPTMIIYGESGKALYDVTPDDDSYRMREVKGDHAIYLNVTSPVPMELQLGCYVNYEGVKYSLEEPPVITKRGARDLAYQCVFSAPQALLKRYRFRNTVDGRLKFQLTAKPHEHLEMLVKNLHLRGDSGWTAGECIDDVEKVIDYDYTVCYDALEMIAEAFGTEWEIQNKVISLKKVEYNKDNPLPLSYGKGNGFVSGVGRNNQNDQDSGLEIVYAIGGDRNVIPEQNTGGEKRTPNRPVTSVAPGVVNPNKELVAPMQTMAAPVQTASDAPVQVQAESSDTSGVAIGNTHLILPRNQVLLYEGEVYATDEQGYYVYNKHKPLTTHKEGALDCSDIYPSRVGTISQVIAVDAANNLYDFVDDSIPADLDYSKCQFDSEKMTVIFQDGMLAGKEFDVNYKHAERRFEIVSQDIDNVTMPNDIFKPVVGGKYAVFNVRLPDAYVCDNETKTGASWDMFRKAAEYLHDHADYLFTFNGKLDGIWASRNWEGIKDRLVPGGTILFSDNQFQPDGVKIRITAIKDYLNDPHRPEIELSNDVLGQRLSGRIAELENREVSMDASAASQRQYTKRTFRDAKSTMQALQEALESFQGEFTEGISPITVNTMQLLAGSERSQFEFLDDNGIVISHTETYDEDKKEFYCAGGTVRYSYGNIMSNNISETTKMASVDAFTSAKLEEDKADKAYYIYIKVNPNSTSATATFLMSETAQEYEQGSYLHLLLGILGKEQTGHRQWVPMYGYTEITPNRIRVDNIVSSDGKTYFNLLKNEIGGRINFTDGIISEEVDMTNAIIRGKIKSAVIELTQENFNEYMTDAPSGVPFEKIMDFNKLLGLKTTVVVKYQPNQCGLYVPGIYWNVGSFTKSAMNALCNLDDFIGNNIRIINKSDYPLGMGSFIQINDNLYGSILVAPNQEICIECVVFNYGEDKKNIVWDVKYKGNIVDY